MSKHRELRDALIARLALIAGGNVQRGRTWAMTEQDDLLVKVYLDTSSVGPETLQGQPDEWTTRIRCEFHARGDSTDCGEDRADALLTEAYGLVMNEPSLSGLCMSCYPVGIAWASEEAETSLGVAQIVFEVLHRTVFNSIAA